MCSWCYGFGPALTQFAANHADLPLSAVMGGLCAYNTQVASDQQKSDIRGHWRHVNRAAFLAAFNSDEMHEAVRYASSRLRWCWRA